MRYLIHFLPAAQTPGKMETELYYNNVKELKLPNNVKPEILNA